MSFQTISTNTKCMEHVDAWSGWEEFPHQFIQFSEEDDANDKTPIGKITILYLFDKIGKGAGGKEGLYNCFKDDVCYLMNRCDYEIFGEIYETHKRVFLNIGYYIIASQYYLRELRHNIKIVEEDQRGTSFLLAMKDQYQEWRRHFVKITYGDFEMGERVVFNCDFDKLVETLIQLQVRGNEAYENVKSLRRRFDRYLTRKAEDEAELIRRQEAEAKKNADELTQRLKDEEDARNLEAMKPKEVKPKKDKPKKAPKNPFPEEIRISEGIWKKNPKWIKWEKENK